MLGAVEKHMVLLQPTPSDVATGSPRIMVIIHLPANQKISGRCSCAWSMSVVAPLCWTFLSLSAAICETSVHRYGWRTICVLHWEVSRDYALGRG